MYVSWFFLLSLKLGLVKGIDWYHPIPWARTWMVEILSQDFICRCFLYPCYTPLIFIHDEPKQRDRHSRIRKGWLSVNCQNCYIINQCCWALDSQHQPPLNMATPALHFKKSVRKLCMQHIRGVGFWAETPSHRWYLEHQAWTNSRTHNLRLFYIVLLFPSHSQT